MLARRAATLLGGKRAQALSGGQGLGWSLVAVVYFLVPKIWAGLVVSPPVPG